MCDTSVKYFISYPTFELKCINLESRAGNPPTWSLAHRIEAGIENGWLLLREFSELSNNNVYKC